jgi:peroxiredoxin
LRGLKMKKFLSFLIAGMLFLGSAPGGSAQVSGKAPEFSLPDIKGGSFTLSETLKTKPVVIVFWATWCPYCVNEIPAVEAYNAKNKEKVAVLGVNLQEKKEKVAKFIEKKKITYTVLTDSGGSVGKLFDVQGIPTVVAINKAGEVVYYGHDIKEMEAQVDLTK